MSPSRSVFGCLECSVVDSMVVLDGVSVVVDVDDIDEGFDVIDSDVDADADAVVRETSSIDE